jgi:hypothetical protein
MKSMSSNFMAVLLLALCGLCGWQWVRQSQLREVHLLRLRELQTATAAKEELTARVKTADAEILRTLQALAELRANSVSKLQHEEATTQNQQLKESVAKQNGIILEQNASLTKASANAQQANIVITQLTQQRDQIAKRLNETIAEMNARQKKAEP